MACSEMCLSMLLTMGVSMLVFFTLFSSLRSYGNTKLYDSYARLDNAYTQTVASESYTSATEEEKTNILTGAFSSPIVRGDVFVKTKTAVGFNSCAFADLTKPPEEKDKSNGSNSSAGEDDDAGVETTVFPLLVKPGIGVGATLFI